MECDQGVVAIQPKKEHMMTPNKSNVSTQLSTFAVRTSSLSSEGGLCEPPPLVQRHLVDKPQSPFWLDSSPVSNPNHEMETLRDAWREMAELLANRPVVEVPEVFEMPAVTTRRVWAKVRYVGPAPFVFVDELADDATDTHD